MWGPIAVVHVSVRLMSQFFTQSCFGILPDCTKSLFYKVFNDGGTKNAFLVEVKQQVT